MATVKTQKENEIKIRQPIVTVAGHVDHGKTSLLDRIRGTSVAAREAGAITQAISCTILPAAEIKKTCGKLLEKYKIQLQFPGFLFVDTPGHAAFSNLRRRGGSLADFVILVVDIREGIMEQTIESIKILKELKVPFLVALNKIDAIAGWQHRSENLAENIKLQADYTKKEFDKLLYSVILRLNDFDFDADLFTRVTNFTKKLALVPCSAKTGEGISEMLVMLVGLAQKFLIKKLRVSEDQARGTILEIKREKDLLYLETIIYDGILQKNDNLVIGNFDNAIETKARAIFEALPLGKGFEPVDNVHAATFVRLQVTTKEEVAAGMPIISVKGLRKIDDAKKQVQKEIEQSIKLDKEGIVVKADSLGSLEALIYQLKKQGVRVKKARIGNIIKADVISAAANLEKNPIEAAVIGFNVSTTEEIEELGKEVSKVKILIDNVIYKLLKDFSEWQDSRELELKRERLDVTMPCKLKVLPYVFRQSKPAVFGVSVLAGTLRQGMLLMDDKGKKIDEVKGIQSEGKSIAESEKGKEVAISMQKVTMGRQVKPGDLLYPSINSEEFKTLDKNKNYLTADELQALKEILDIRRKKDKLWGV